MQHLELARRDFLRLGALAPLGLGLADWLRQQAQGASSGLALGPARQCILIWLDGGPSHLDTFDPKPEAPQEVRGPFGSIETALPGVRVCELLPQIAQRMHHIALIRSVTSPLGEHNLGTHYLLSGYKPTPSLEYPAWGSVVSALQPQRAGAGSPPLELPAHIAVPDFRVGGAGFSGNGYLDVRHRPFSVGGDPAKPDFRVQDLELYPGVDVVRLQRRRRFQQQFDQWEQHLSRSAAEAAPDDAWQQAYRLVLSPQSRQAFAVEEESPAMRDRYGRRSLGQSCLLARRLVERGVPFVTVHSTGWDTHTDAYTRLKEGFTGARTPVGLIPNLDQAVSALMDDLQQRGLLQQTLIVVMGEFGRTPKMNTAGGRDHWPRVFSVLLTGLGIGGQVIGASDDTGESPADRPITPEDLSASVFGLLGFDPQLELQTQDGRPVRLSRDGAPLAELGCTTDG